MFNLEIEKVKELSKSFNIIPVSMEVYADMETPISIFRRLSEPGCFLLESVEGGEKWARYSFVGRKPFLSIYGKDDRCTIETANDTRLEQGNPVELLRNIMQDYKSPSLGNLPRFTGGAVGFMGYDVIRFYEDLPMNLKDDMDVPDFHFVLTDEVIAYDHLKQKLHIIVNLHVNDQIEREYLSVTERIKEIYNELQQTRCTLDEPFEFAESKENKNIEIKSNIDKAQFCRNVEIAKERIKNGDIFQVVLSQRFEVQTSLSPLSVYRALRTINPSAYMYFLQFKGYSIIGSSPEMLVRVDGKTVETCPIAGTRPRGRDESEDRLMEQELLSDQKELAEHTMLVDLGRNDIGKISEFGSVKVVSPMHIEKYSHVMHIVTNVVGALKDGTDCFDALASILPAGTVSGAPKVMAMKIIDELENTKRGPYAGALGYIGFDGKLDMCITIRTLIFKQGKAFLQAGAGIVADSVPEKEYEETCRKAAALLQAVREAGEII